MPPTTSTPSGRCPSCSRPAAANWARAGLSVLRLESAPLIASLVVSSIFCSWSPFAGIVPEWAPFGDRLVATDLRADLEVGSSLSSRHGSPSFHFRRNGLHLPDECAFDLARPRAKPGEMPGAQRVLVIQLVGRVHHHGSGQRE